ncbi:bifunctional metallophosphatase/5'-nucleotidase [Bacillus cihuensis]|uniref:bifunctional metallophosphatase/5'-nucleotidase n=1 Tax=Bacillus cihuensis TaxID=1208599 RepID=UPI00041ED973|nr:bifunctional UDP-sugar hydrolase/5'-nucleotidase [Bacillus cihuensis]
MVIKQLQLLVTSDVHGYIMPTTFRRTEETLGLAKAASLIEQLRHERPSILIDNGDLLQGSPLTYYHQQFHAHEPNPIIEVANALHYDLAVFGNHEFNYGLSFLNKSIQESHFPWLTGNIVFDDGTSFTIPYMIKEIEGVRIGIVGVTTHFVPIWEDPSHIEGIQFRQAFESAKKWLEHLHHHENVDVTVLCYHGGFSHNLTTGELLEADTGENEGYQMCKELDFDIFITGHQHRDICTKAFGKSIVQPGTKGVCVAAISLDVAMENGKVISIKHEPSLHYVDQHTPINNRVVNKIERVYSLTEKWLDEPIGQIEGNMLYEDAFDVRVSKHPYIEFIQHVQMEVTNAQISCTALFNDGPGGFPPQVTMRDIVTNYIYPNTLKVLCVSGRHIVEALEQSATYFTIKNETIAVSDSFIYPKHQPYNYDMWEGIEYVMDIHRPIGQRITEVIYQGHPLDLTASYEVVMNNYRASGGGNFSYFADCPIIKDIQIDMTELIANYFRKNPIVQATCHQNWTIL